MFTEFAGEESCHMILSDEDYHRRQHAAPIIPTKRTLVVILCLICLFAGITIGTAVGLMLGSALR